MSPVSRNSSLARAHGETRKAGLFVKTARAIRCVHRFRPIADPARGMDHEMRARRGCADRALRRDAVRRGVREICFGACKGRRWTTALRPSSAAIRRRGAVLPTRDRDRGSDRDASAQVRLWLRPDLVAARSASSASLRARACRSVRLLLVTQARQRLRETGAREGEVWIALDRLLIERDRIAAYRRAPSPGPSGRAGKLRHSRSASGWWRRSRAA